MAILIIGYGNTLRRDDGVGPHVAERLSAVLGAVGGVADPAFHGAGSPTPPTNPNLQPAIEILIRHMLTPELAEPISRASLAILIDASVELAAGEVKVERVEPGDAPPQSMLHHMTPRALGCLAKVLYQRCPPIVLISIGVEDLNHGEGLSAAATRGAEEAMGRVRQVMNDEGRSLE